MAETSQNARALRPTKRTDVKGRPAAPDADASVRGQEETETHTSARGAARVAARKAAREAQAQSEREQKAAAKAAKKAAKASEKGSRGFAFWKKGGAEKDGQADAGETTSLSIVTKADADAAASGAAAGPAPDARAARPTHRSEADARALRFATAGGRGDLSSSHTDPTAGDDAEGGAARGSSRRHAAASEKTFDFTGAANSAKDFCRRHLVVVVVLAAIAVVVASIYGPAKTYYLAWRTGTALQTSYDSLTKSNDDLQSDVERLQTKEGIEDEARKKGYVSPGETAVDVQGLPDDSAAQQTQQEDPWYIQLGDTIFGYTAS